MSVARLIAVGRISAALACIAPAAWLAFHDKAGWGWFLFVAVILGSITSEGKDE